MFELEIRMSQNRIFRKFFFFKFLFFFKGISNNELEFLNQEVTDEFQFMQPDSTTNTASGLISIFKSFSSSNSKTKGSSKPS